VVVLVNVEPRLRIMRCRMEERKRDLRHRFRLEYIRLDYTKCSSSNIGREPNAPAANIEVKGRNEVGAF
jgi:hypothetical protein